MKGKELLKTFGAGVVIVLVPKIVEAGESKVYNWSDHEGVANCEKVLISEDLPMNGEYISLPGDTITRMYGWGPTVGNPNDHKLSDLFIEFNKAYFNKLFLTVDVLVPNGADNYIKIKKPTSAPNFEKRNFFMKQDSNSPSSHTDPNIYDLLDLTNYFTQDGRINLPNITASTPRGTDNPYDLLNHIISNYADLHPPVFDGNLPDGKVTFADFAVFAAYWQRTDANETNNWHKGADLSREGDVNEIDLGAFAEQWLCDPNTISKAMQFLPKELYEKLNETARQILDYKGQTNQSIVCKFYQNPLNQSLSPDITQRLLARKEDNELEQKLQKTNHNHEPTWASNQTSLSSTVMTYQNGKRLYGA